MASCKHRGIPWTLVPLACMAAVLLAFLCIAPSHADLTPNTFDTGFDTGTGLTSPVLAVALQPDGRVLIGGPFSTVAGLARGRVARLEPDGSLDISFVPDAITKAGLPVVYALAPQPDGKVIIAGTFDQVDGVDRDNVARLMPDGRLDPTFDASSGPNNLVSAVALQPDGKVLIAGAFSQVGTTSRNGIARLNADGSLDTSFDPGAGALDISDNPSVETLLVMGDGVVLMGGSFIKVDGQTRQYVARLDSTGNLLPALTAQPSSYVYALALQPDGRILLGGAFSQVGGQSRNKVARLEASTSLDTSFDPGTGAGDTVRALDLQPDGRILMGGDFTTFDGTTLYRIARLQMDGSLDTTYDTGGGANATVWDLAVQPHDGKALIGGSFGTFDGAGPGHMVRVNADGTRDAAFYYSDGANAQIMASVLQPDGRILIGGNFTKFDSIDRLHVARLRADGTLDAAFDTSIAGPDSGVQSMLPLPGDQVLIGGSFTAFGATPISYTARLSPDGSLDTAYNPAPTSKNAQIMALARQDDGKIFIGGSFTRVGAPLRRRIARLVADGGLDTTFYPGEGFEGGVGFTSVRALQLQPDGKLLAGGDFEFYDDQPRSMIARLNSNGSLDTSFVPGSGASDKVLALALQPDGKVLIGGEFESFDGVTRYHVARLESDGSLDASFDPGFISDTVSSDQYAKVSALVLQPDGRIIIGGKFTQVQGVPCSRIARLNADGSLDATFDASQGASGNITGLLQQPDGKVLVRGGFSLYAGVDVKGLVRINAMTAPTLTSAGPDFAVVGQAYTHTFTGLGVPLPTFYLSGGDLPPGLRLDGATGLLTGTPTVKATYAVTVTASNYVTPSAVQALSLLVKGQTTTTVSGWVPAPSAAHQPLTVEFDVISPWGMPTGNVNVYALNLGLHSDSPTYGRGEGPSPTSPSGAGVSCTATVAQGSCTLTPNFPGTWLLFATYQGDPEYAASDALPANHMVDQAPSTTSIMATNPERVLSGQPISVEFTVTSPWGAPDSVPSGDVTISGGGQSCQASVEAGACALTFDMPGSVSLTAAYAGDLVFAASQSAGQVVDVWAEAYHVYLPLVVREW